MNLTCYHYGLLSHAPSLLILWYLKDPHLIFLIFWYLVVEMILPIKKYGVEWNLPAVVMGGYLVIRIFRVYQRSIRWYLTLGLLILYLNLALYLFWKKHTTTDRDICYDIFIHLLVWTTIAILLVLQPTFRNSRPLKNK